MSVVVVTGSSSSCSATFTTRSNHYIKNSHLTPSKTPPLPHCQKTSWQGLSLNEAKRGVSDSFLESSNQDWRKKFTDGEPLRKEEGIKREKEGMRDRLGILRRRPQNAVV